MGNSSYRGSEPIAITLDAGTYYRCQCGRSANYPFCDGSHKGTEQAPLQFELAEKKTVYLCDCGHSASRPYCDGSHAK